MRIFKHCSKHSICQHIVKCLLQIGGQISAIKIFPSLEFLPYRRIDWTAARDEKNHSYFCSHGYVCVRVDMRGSGDSEGFYYDEYEKQEQDDCCDVIDWISQQPWCTGNVGKFQGLCSHRSQKMSKCGKNISDILGCFCVLLFHN